MDIPVLVEPVVNHGFRAICGEPLRLETEAPTREEALQKMRQLIECRIAAGAEVVALNVTASEHPLAPFAGSLKNDPLLGPWKQAMADYRASSENGLTTP